MREDLRAALVNAIDRGERIETAVESLINAGYDRQEVLEAAKMARGTVFVDIRAAPTIQTLTAKPPEPFPKSSPHYSLPEKKGKGKKIMLIGVIILLLAVAAGIIGYLAYTYLM